MQLKVEETDCTGPKGTCITRGRVSIVFHARLRFICYYSNDDLARLMTLGLLPAPLSAAAVSRHRLLQQERRLVGCDVISGPRAAPTAVARTRLSAASGGGVPALQPRPVPSPQQSAADGDEQARQPGADTQADSPDARQADGSRPRLRRGSTSISSRSEPVQQSQGRAGRGAARLAELPAGDADSEPGRGPAKRSLDVGSPRRREATLARALLRLPAAGTETDFGAVLGGEQLTGPEITRCALTSA